MTTPISEVATTPIRIPIGGGKRLDADMTIPPDAKGVVLFAHGSGSSRRSPRNRYVASELNSAHLGTVLADLLTAEEEEVDEHTSTLRFDIPMLTQRLVQMIDWAHTDDRIATLPIGLFGASTGAAAALDAAAARPELVRAVVSRGGRADLAADIDRVATPTLLLVGGRDIAVLDLNNAALRRLNGQKKLEIVLGATHLFEEPGALQRVAAAAGEWFRRYLPVTADRLIKR